MKILMRIILVVVIICIAAAFSFFLVKTKPKAKKKAISVGAPLVETLPLTPVDERLSIEALGVVVPAKEVTVFPQVSGQVESVSEMLLPGGLFRRDEELLKLDDRDYRILARQREADVTKALLELKTEKGRKMIAEQEWELLSSEIDPTEEGRDLALRKPHLKSAETSLLSARSTLQKARLDIERASITAPFNAVVVEKFVDRGQYVSPGSKLVSLVGTDVFWIQVSIPSKHLEWLKIPGINADRGSRVKIVDTRDGKQRMLREGAIVRLLADVDPKGQMARLLVSVNDPYNLQSPPENDAVMPLLLGSYVNVVFEGPLLSDIYRLPRYILRDNDHLWILGSQNRLELRDVSVIWKTDAYVYFTGPEPGEQVITSRISTPVKGMELLTASDRQRKQKPDNEPPVGKRKKTK